MDRTRWVDGKELRCGFTTGSCAAAAAKAACLLLFGGAESASLREVEIHTPEGVSLSLPLETIRFSPVTAEISEMSEAADTAQLAAAGRKSHEIFPGEVSVSVIKDAGDDPDITDGLSIVASVRALAAAPDSLPQVIIDGGEGVGRVSKAGLDQPVGAAAINSVPRQMIETAVREAMKSCAVHVNVHVIISIPGGEAVAAKTFNPRLGIIGGLSILGTKGIVEPMSSAAIRDTVRTEIKQAKAEGHDRFFLVPGNYGENFIRQQLKLTGARVIQCSNWIGDALEFSATVGFRRLFLVGHIGKMVKLGLGMPNTHSNQGDGRIEFLLMAALRAGADLETLKKISACTMTDAALELLYQAGQLEGAMAMLRERIEDFLERRMPGDMEMAFMVFTKDPKLPSILCKSRNADDVLKLWQSQLQAPGQGSCE